MLVIKNIIDSDKIHAQIQENKLKKPKQGKFQRKLQEVIAQQEAMKEQQRKNNHTKNLVHSRFLF
jgi:YidC/Oxa1 family membrane protein insertase